MTTGCWRVWVVLAAAVGVEASAGVLPLTAAPPAEAVAVACSERIARNPFPSRAAQARLVAGLPRALRESRERSDRARSEVAVESLLPAREHHRMGWTLSDEAYWAHIPSAARTLPVDWSRLPGITVTNTEVGGRREVRLARGPEYDHWLLRDPERGITACIAVERQRRRVYFMEVGRESGGSWHFAAPFDNCYSCHASGPRVIRPLNETGLDRATLARFNRLILSYGACDFGGDPDPAVRGEALPDARCTACHDGALRGRLYAIHDRAIRFKTTRDLTMPP